MHALDLANPSRSHHDADSTAADAPLLALRALDTLWIQVTGTLCNLTCRHCFITCGPNNASHAMMSYEDVMKAVDDAVGLGVREFYFTGGEPFLHPQILDLIRAVLAVGPLSILTNGVLIDANMARSLREIFVASRYSLDLRVSLDGTSPAENDPIRGRGTFAQILGGIEALASEGLSPVVTVTEVDDAPPDGRARFRQLLQDIGLRHPRLKYLAPFRIGREAVRLRGYRDEERLREGDLLPADEDVLQCNSCRAVTAKGVWPCPILIEHPEARMGDTLQDGLSPIRLRHRACHTCHVEGVSCRT